MEWLLSLPSWKFEEAVRAGDLVRETIILDNAKASKMAALSLDRKNNAILRFSRSLKMKSEHLIPSLAPTEEEVNKNWEKAMKLAGGLNA